MRLKKFDFAQNLHASALMRISTIRKVHLINDYCDLTLTRISRCCHDLKKRHRHVLRNYMQSIFKTKNLNTVHKILVLYLTKHRKRDINVETRDFSHHHEFRSWTFSLSHNDKLTQLHIINFVVDLSWRLVLYSQRRHIWQNFSPYRSWHIVRFIERSFTEQVVCRNCISLSICRERRLMQLEFHDFVIVCDEILSFLSSSVSALRDFITTINICRWSLDNAEWWQVIRRKKMRFLFIHEV